MSNWSNLDYFLPMALTLEANALVDIKGGKVAINEGAVPKVVEGFQFEDSPAQALKTSFIPLTDGINCQVDDNQVDVFMYDLPILDDDALYGALTGNTTDSLQVWRGTTGNHVCYSAGKLVNTNGLGSKSFLAVTKDPVEVISHIDGIQDISAAWGLGGALPNLEMYIGARNLNGNIQLSSSSLLSCLSIGASVGVNQVAKNDNYRQFLTDLGIDLTP